MKWTIPEEADIISSGDIHTSLVTNIEKSNLKGM